MWQGLCAAIGRHELRGPKSRWVMPGPFLLISPQVSLQPEVPGSQVAAWRRHIPRSSPSRSYLENLELAWMPRGLARHARKQAACRVVISERCASCLDSFPVEGLLVPVTKAVRSGGRSEDVQKSVPKQAPGSTYSDS